MSSPSSALDKQASNKIWDSYFVPPLAASIAIIPSFCDLAAKSAQQLGQPLPSLLDSLKDGLKAAPTVGLIIGYQMVLQQIVEKALVGEARSKNFSTIFASSAIVGIASAPILAIFNGQTMGLRARESLRKFSAKQAFAITIQETAFVAGLSVADKLAELMKQTMGNSPTVDYTAAFIAGATGSLAGHPANTALTRWQSGMPLDSFRQSMWGALRKARAIGCFSVVYKIGKEKLLVSSSKE